VGAVKRAYGYYCHGRRRVKLLSIIISHPLPPS
jgi:hypothetical protein